MIPSPVYENIQNIYKSLKGDVPTLLNPDVTGTTLSRMVGVGVVGVGVVVTVESKVSLRRKVDHHLC